MLGIAAIGLADAPAAPTTPAPEEGVWAGSSSVAFAVAGRHGGVYAIRSNGSGLHRLTTAGGGDGGLAVSPDGQTLLFGSGTSLYAIGIDGHGLRRVGTGFDPSWSPDGKRIAFTRDDGVYLMKRDGTDAHKLVTNRYPEFNGVPTWSPDGKKVAYVACSAPYLSEGCEHQYKFDVYVIETDGSRKHRVTPRSGFPQCPAWSNAGKLAFLNTDDTVALVKAGGGLRTLGPGGCPSWAPGGRRLAVPTATGVALMNADGSGRRQIMILQGSHSLFRTVAWSADGRSLAVVGGESRGHLWVVGANGNGLKKLL
jgi:Tol biopolymer transport system component